MAFIQLNELPVVPEAGWALSINETFIPALHSSYAIHVPIIPAPTTVIFFFFVIELTIGEYKANRESILRKFLLFTYLTLSHYERGKLIKSTHFTKMILARVFVEQKVNLH